MRVLMSLNLPYMSITTKGTGVPVARLPLPQHYLAANLSSIKGTISLARWISGILAEDNAQCDKTAIRRFIYYSATSRKNNRSHMTLEAQVSTCLLIIFMLVK